VPSLRITTKILATLLSFFLLGLMVNFVFASDNWIEWRQIYGGTNDDGDMVRLIETFDGGYALVGNTYSFSAGDSDFWLLKTNELGVEEWNTTYGGENSDIATSLVQTSDRGYALAGNTRSFGAGDYDFWLIKTDSVGNIEWTKTYGGETNENANALLQTSDGGYALAGRVLSVGEQFYDFWLVKTDKFGNMQWNKTYGQIGRDSAYSLVQTSDGGYALAGDTNSFGAGALDFWLVKTDDAGNVQWNMTYGGVKSDIPSSLIITSDGGFALGGLTILSDVRYSDFWLIKTDAYGNAIWNSTYGGSGEESVGCLIETSNGGFVLVGDTREYIGASTDVLLITTDKFGNLEWNRTLGGEKNEVSNSVVQSLDGGFVLGGETKAFSEEEGDLWLIKVNQMGVQEFPSWVILPLFFIVTILILFFIRKKRSIQC